MGFKSKQAAKEYQAAWFQANKDRLAAKRAANLKAWRLANPEKQRLQQKRSSRTQREKRKAAGLPASATEWYRLNPERARRKARKKRNANREKYREYWRNNYHRHAIETIRRIAEYQQTQAENVGDYYVWQRLYKIHKRTKQTGPLKAGPKTIEQKRKEIKLWRTRTQFKLLEGAAQLARALSGSSKR
jgi:hypothetical protein